MFTLKTGSFFNVSANGHNEISMRACISWPTLLWGNLWASESAYFLCFFHYVDIGNNPLCGWSDTDRLGDTSPRVQAISPILNTEKWQKTHKNHYFKPLSKLNCQSLFTLWTHFKNFNVSFVKLWKDNSIKFPFNFFKIFHMIGGTDF